MGETMTAAQAPRRASPTPIPDHVPADLVIDPTPYLPRLNAEVDPFRGTDGMLDALPRIFYTNKLQAGSLFDSAWVVTRYKDLMEVFRNEAALYSVGEAVFFHRLVGETFTMIPLGVDPPDHAKYRIFLTPWFTPKAVTKMEAGIRAAINELIDAFEDKGECDVAYDFGRLFPVRIFLDLMGFPRNMIDEFLTWEYAILHSRGDAERVKWGMGAALAWVREFIEHTKANPNDSLTSYIVHGDIRGVPLTDDEVIGMVAFLWIAGLDTVAATTALMFRRLALEPDLQQRLRDAPELIPAAVDEFLRMQPLVNVPRLVKQDHELAGVKMKEGDRIFCFFSSGNFDPEMFESPREFRFDRNPDRHFTLGGGPHVCLGKHLARRELRIALSEFLRRIPRFSMKPDADLEAFPGLMAVGHVPLVWNAGTSGTGAPSDR